MMCMSKVEDVSFERQEDLEKEQDRTSSIHSEDSFNWNYNDVNDFKS